MDRREHEEDGNAAKSETEAEKGDEMWKDKGEVE